MIYLLDANCLINAKKFYYQINRVPEFWEWLAFCGKNNWVKIPQEIYGEFSDKEDSNGVVDPLSHWSSREPVRDALLFETDVDSDLLNRVIYEGYLENPTDSDLEKMGMDPFLIAHALSDSNAYCVVTSEVSKPKKVGANKKIPDVCNDLGVECCDLYTLIDKLDFSTAWKSQFSAGDDGTIAFQ